MQTRIIFSFFFFEFLPQQHSGWLKRVPQVMSTVRSEILTASFKTKTSVFQFGVANSDSLGGHMKCARYREAICLHFEIRVRILMTNISI